MSKSIHCSRYSKWVCIMGGIRVKVVTSIKPWWRNTFANRVPASCSEAPQHQHRLMKANQEWSALKVAAMCDSALPLHLLLLHISSSPHLLVVMETPNVTDFYQSENPPKPSYGHQRWKKSAHILRAIQHHTKHPRGCTAHHLWSISQLEIKGLPWWQMVWNLFFSLSPLWLVWGWMDERVNGKDSSKRFLISWVLPWLSADVNPVQTEQLDQEELWSKKDLIVLAALKKIKHLFHLLIVSRLGEII